MSHDLETIQTWLQSQVIAPEENNMEPGAVIKEEGQLNPNQRLNIYQNAYKARLTGALEAEFPCTRAVMGEELFRFISTIYIRKHPSSSYSLFHLCEHFPKFLDTNKPQLASIQNRNDVDFFIELAEIERICLLFSHQKGEENKKERGQSKFPPERFLKLSTLFHVGQYQFDIKSTLTSFKENGSIHLGENKLTYLAISRVDYIVQLFEISENQFFLLKEIERRPSTISFGSLNATKKKWVKAWSKYNFFQGRNDISE